MISQREKILQKLRELHNDLFALYALEFSELPFNPPDDYAEKATERLREVHALRLRNLNLLSQSVYKPLKEHVTGICLNESSELSK